MLVRKMLRKKLRWMNKGRRSICFSALLLRTQTTNTELSTLTATIRETKLRISNETTSGMEILKINSLWRTSHSSHKLCSTVLALYIPYGIVRNEKNLWKFKLLQEKNSSVVVGCCCGSFYKIKFYNYSYIFFLKIIFNYILF